MFPNRCDFPSTFKPYLILIICRYICTEDYSNVGLAYGEIYSTVLMVMQYVIPLIVLLFTYTSIAAVIWCHRIPGEAENCRDQRIARSKRKVKLEIIYEKKYLINIVGVVENMKRGNVLILHFKENRHS